jgi:hypothetical protein
MVPMLTQLLYIIDTFPFNDGITTWIDEKTRNGLLA